MLREDPALLRVVEQQTEQLSDAQVLGLAQRLQQRVQQQRQT